MDSSQVEQLLSRIESLLELHGANQFKSRAYGRAARSLKGSGKNVVAIVEAGEPIDIDGIGSGIAAEIEEIVRTGTTAQLEELMEKTPHGLLDVMSIRGLGAKKVRALWDELGVETLEDLEAKANSGEVAGLKGFGKKTQEGILASIAELRANAGKMRLNRATEVAEELLPKLRELPGVGRAEIAGRLRRGGEEFSAVEFVIETEDPEALESALNESDLFDDVQRKDSVIGALFDQSYRVFLHLSDPDHFVVAYHQRSAASDYRFMVSIPLSEHGYTLEEDALLKDGENVRLESEEELYELAGMQFVPPELREGLDEVRKALDNNLPTLVEPGDLKGMLHVHSTWSDGRNSIAELAEQAHAMGYGYLLMCDHSKAAAYANGLDEFRLEAQGVEIDGINEKYDPNEFRVLKGIECDIMTDGTLDLSDDSLAALDCVVVSVHSNFTLSEEAQTDRVCRALENRYASILAHPTGRLLLRRNGYPIDLKRVISHAADHGKFVELNANPVRLDLNWRMLRYARRKGVKVSINPDAHSTPEFENLKYGVIIARKGGLSAEDVLNTLPADEFLAAIAASRNG